jgi:hypothetical protein
MTQLRLLRDCGQKLVQIVSAGPIECMSAGPVRVLLTSPQPIPPNTGKFPLSSENTREIDRMLALRCDYDPSKPSGESVHHLLDVFAIALQLVKPTHSFLDLWLQLDERELPELITTPVRQLGYMIDPGMYLAYQQHNVIEEADVMRAISLSPRLAAALDPRYGSWDHPVLPIHRAVIFFCQGYSISPPDPRQFLWAAGLDCLYASKLDRKKQGSREIIRRMEKLLGATLEPYQADTVSLPVHQKTRPSKTLSEVAKHIFDLRNAFAHGLKIPDPNWLTTPGLPEESGYAYQLLEQTEIVLRLTLLRILEDQTLFDIFSDPALLDAYF